MAVPTQAELEVRTARILSEEQLARLHGARVVLFGVGGVGSNCAEALVRSGVGTLCVVDGDCVDASNLNRQAIAFISTIGKRKVEVMCDFARAMNPYVTVLPFDTFVTPQNLEAVLGQVRAAAGGIDFVIDAIDTVSTKIALAAWATSTNTPFIAAMGGANKRHPECIELADISHTRNDALCRVMRRELKRRGITGVRVAYSSEPPHPVPLAPGTTRASRSNLGTLSFMPAALGHVIAGDVIRTLTGLE
jgi:tRNA A37 threonylcarbamoyladenosine dehydratase